MARYGETDEGGGGPKFTGFVEVGPPFHIRKEFFEPEGEWAQGRTIAAIGGTIKRSLPYAVTSYDGSEKTFAPDECVGHEVAFFPEHPLQNHIVGDGPDEYRWLATRRDRFKRPWPSFWLEMLLSKAGAATEGLMPWAESDDDRLLQGIVALLETGGSWPIAVWNSRGADIERQVPPGTQVLAQFHKFLYWDWKANRPTWVLHQEETDSGSLRSVRETTFLLRVVAPKPWAGTLLRMPVNYAIRRGQDKETGEDMWEQHEMAQFSDVAETLGVEMANFVEDVDEALLREVDVGGPANLLGPLEIKLQEMSDRRLLRITIPEKWNIKFKDVMVADALAIEKVTGEVAFTPPGLRTIGDLSEAQISAVIKEDDEAVPGFGGVPEPEEELPRDKVIEIAKEMAGFSVWERQAAGVAPLTQEGKAWAAKVLLPLFEIVGLRRETPFVGWTNEKVAKMKNLLADSLFVDMCEKLANEKDKAPIVEYGTNYLVGIEEGASDSAF